MRGFCDLLSQPGLINGIPGTGVPNQPAELLFGLAILRRPDLDEGANRFFQALQEQTKKVREGSEKALKHEGLKNLNRIDSFGPKMKVKDEVLPSNISLPVE